MAHRVAASLPAAAGAQSPHAQDALLGLLLPFWQAVIAAVVLIAVVLSVRRLAQRGPSRMTRALVLLGATIITLVTIGLLLEHI